MEEDYGKLRGFCRKDFQLAGEVASSVLLFGIDAWI